MSEAITKRANFDVTQEQQEILALAKAASNASNIKEGVLRACQVMVSLARETAKGNQIFVGKSREKAARFVVPELEMTPNDQWKWLAQRDHSWKRQLWVKGRKLLASSVWNDMRINAMSKQDAMANWALPEEAIDEICTYCEENLPFIQAEAAEEKIRLMGKGVQLEAAHR
ncbi:MAG: hypothetical protein D4S02_16410 [Rhodocyclaceae bacterium]|nr:MAG: hypothetical protein D4S02_16410 [Rhodocyclaceae bacterium]